MGLGNLWQSKTEIGVKAVMTVIWIIIQMARIPALVQMGRPSKQDFIAQLLGRAILLLQGVEHRAEDFLVVHDQTCYTEIQYCL